MKIGESFKVEDGKLVHFEAFDPNKALADATYMRHKREATGGKLLNFVNGEVCEPQYAYPPWLEQQWSLKWGVRQDDPAFEDVVQIELSSGSYEKFRI
jgi:hypothetical protein